MDLSPANASPGDRAARGLAIATAGIILLVLGGGISPASAQEATVLFEHSGAVDPELQTTAWGIVPSDQGTVPGTLGNGTAAIEVGPLDPDLGAAGGSTAAWAIDDRSSVSGSRWRYEQVPSAQNVADAENLGWTLRGRIRVATESDSQSGLADPVDASILLEYNEGLLGSGDRYLLEFGANASGRPTIEIDGRQSVVFSGGNNAYSLVELTYRPDFEAATLFVNNEPVLEDVASLDGSAIGPRLNFGSGSSGGQGRGHFASVEWEIGLPLCFNGQDEDGDGLFDDDDLACAGQALQDADEVDSGPCFDGLDNDGDGFIDLADPSCQVSTGANPTERAGAGFPCDDGLDNDGDGQIDIEDAGCGGYALGLGEAGEFVVNTTADRPDSSPGDDVCETSVPGECSLRAAIEEANNSSLPFLGIELPAGDYPVLRSLGHLEATNGIAIVGPDGAAATRIFYEDDGNATQAPNNGGVIALTSGSLSTLYGVTIEEGSSLGNGGGIYAAGGFLFLIDSVIRANEVLGGAGGGIFTDGFLLLNRTEVLANRSRSTGAGIRVSSGGGLIALDSRIENNTLIQGAVGGGIFAGVGVSTHYLFDTLVRNNSAPIHGGGVYSSGPMAIVRSSISENHASNGGGGLYFEDRATLSGSVVAANTVSTSGAGPLGAGITSRARLIVANSTIHENGLGSAAGVNVLLEDPKDLTLINSIVAGSETGLPNCSYETGMPGSVLSRGGNISDDASCIANDPGLGDQIGDPMLGSLQAGIALIPQPGSPAIDAADNAACPLLDRLRSPRPVDGDLPQDGQADCDVGAIEVPEPGIALGALIGAAWLTWVRRRFGLCRVRANRTAYSGPPIRDV